MAKIVRLRKGRKIIFVGDTHGDLQASQKVIANYFKKENKIVFLGDYVDRGAFSRENLEFLLKIRAKHPQQVFLLQGNHEGHRILNFSPADFWENLTEKDYQKYASVLEELPLIVVCGPIIALHGALPEVEKLAEIEKIELGDKKWLEIVWGDFKEEKGGFLGMNPITGRPEFGQDWFEEIMEKIKRKILIRSHQPQAPRLMFQNRCLTLFTSSAYGGKREIAIFNWEKEIADAKDLEIVQI